MHLWLSPFVYVPWLSGSEDGNLARYGGGGGISPPPSGSCVTIYFIKRFRRERYRRV